MFFYFSNKMIKFLILAMDAHKTEYILNEWAMNKQQTQMFRHSCLYVFSSLRRTPAFDQI